MSSPRDAEVQLAGLDDEAQGVSRPFRRHAMLILWPAFAMAGVLEVLVFVVVDPASLQWFGIEPLRWPVQAVYTVTFLIFWGVIATSAAFTRLLEHPGPEPER